ncbi:hypothetical protein [Methylocapsa acidiphila]|uniref:hypothetical protein n=1 Tax=Methylocapsa acidiphila TaxID=133552 RepID=UPI00040AECAE|nr:hypothetical protein [Methylocapsa acidiphila]
MANGVDIKFGADIAGVVAATAQLQTNISRFSSASSVNVLALNNTFARLDDSISKLASVKVEPDQHGLRDFAVTAAATTIALRGVIDATSSIGGGVGSAFGSIASGIGSAAAAARSGVSSIQAYIAAINSGASGVDRWISSAERWRAGIDQSRSAMIAAVSTQAAFAGNLTAVEQAYNYAGQGTARWLAKFQQIPDVSAQTAAAMQAQITSIHNYSVELESLLIDVLPAFAKASGEKLPEAWSRLAKALDDPLMKVKQIAAEMPNVTAAELANADAAARSGNQMTAIGAILGMLVERWGRAGTAVGGLAAKVRDLIETIGQAAAAEGGLDIAADITASKLERETELIGKVVEGWNARKAAIGATPLTPEQIKLQSDKVTGEANPISTQMDALQGKIDAVQRRIEGLNSDWQSFTTSPDGSTWNADMEKATTTLAKLRQEMTGLKAQAAGGTPTQLADLASAQKDIQGGEDQLRTARATLAALREQQAAATDLATKTQLGTEAARQELRVRQQELDLVRSQNALIKAKSGDTDAKAALTEARANQTAINQVYAQGTQARIDAETRVRTAQAAADRQGQQDAAATAQSQYQIALNGFALREALIKAEAAQHKISVQQETQQLETVASDRAARETQLQDKLMQIWGEGTNAYRNAELKKTEIASEEAARRAKIEEENAKKAQQPFDQGWSAVTGQLNSAITSALIQGNRSAGRQFAVQLAEDVGNSLLTSMENAIKTALQNSAIGSLLGGAGGGGGGSGIFGSILHAIGIPGFATGAWELPGDMIAQVHQGEMIVPAGPAAALRGALSGGGAAQPQGGHTFNIAVNYSAEKGTTLDKLRQHSREIAKMLQTELRYNPSLRPDF